jgi:hypothetical protein
MPAAAVTARSPSLLLVSPLLLLLLTRARARPPAALPACLPGVLQFGHDWSGARDLGNGCPCEQPDWGLAQPPAATPVRG